MDKVRESSKIKEIAGDWRGYPIAIVLVFLATWLKYLAQPNIIPADVPILYFVAIVPTAIFFGLGPSIVVCVLSLLAYDLFFFSSFHSFTFFNILNAPILLIFLAVGILFSYLSSDLRRKNQIATKEITARKQTEKELVDYRDHLEDVVRQRTIDLEKERSLLRTIMNSAGNSHLVYLDCNFNFVKVNAIYAKTCGYTPEEMVGKNHFDLYPHEENQAIFTRVKNTGTAEEYHDKPFVFPDHPERGITYWDWTLIPVKNSQGNVEGLVFSLTETTARVQAEQVLEESEERFYKAFRSNPAALVISKFPDGTILDINESYEKLYGYNRHELVGHKTTDLNVYAEIKDRAEIIRLLAETGKVSAREMTFRNKEGKFIDGIFSTELIHVRGQDYAFSSILDITARKRAEQALRESEQRLHLAQEAANAGTWEWDLRTNKNYWSREIWRLYGLDPDSCEPSYEAWTQTIYPDDRQSAENAVREAATQGTKINTEWRVTGRAGEERWLMSVGQPILDNHGKPIRYIGIVVDVTERKKFDQMKDNFIGMISHELKTPLTVIIGALNVAESEGVTLQERKELIGDAAGSAEELAIMIDNLLELSRFQSNRLSLQTKSIYIEPVVRSVVKKLQKRTVIHRLVVEVPPDLPAVNIDSIRIERVLNNLIENAIKYSPNGGNVKISGLYSNDQLTICVSDEGIGISQEAQTRLFSRFQRLDIQEKHNIAGVGLGLSVCKVIIEAHGGKIWVESQIGHGSSFCFTLPIKDIMPKA